MASHKSHPPGIVDNIDWLKVFAIILVSIDHFGYFFVENADWWNAVGRMAAPPFFFLLGYAQTRQVPLRWLWIGVLLTALDSWNNDWTWTSANILISLALIRFSRPYILKLMQHFGWLAFTLIVAGLIVLLPATSSIVDYGAEGWLWALFGLCQRLYINSLSTIEADGMSGKPHQLSAMKINNTCLLRSLACLAALSVYIWQEQMEFMFSSLQLGTVIFGVCTLSFALYKFQQGPSRFRPAGPVVATLHFVGRNTLEIYAIQLAAFELAVGLLPGVGV